MAGLPAPPASKSYLPPQPNRPIRARDLTISVEAGLPFAELSANWPPRPNGALDGPWSDEATVGGMIAANINGSRRRLYGTARDLVIGMKFATLDGKLVQSGGMVVRTSRVSIWRNS